MAIVICKERYWSNNQYDPQNINPHICGFFCTFIAFPDRNELGKRLQSLGADINTAISGKTTVVVMGIGAGPSKIKKIEDWRSKGHDIRIIYEEELRQILK